MARIFLDTGRPGGRFGAFRFICFAFLRNFLALDLRELVPPFLMLFGTGKPFLRRCLRAAFRSACARLTFSFATLALALALAACCLFLLPLVIALPLLRLVFRTSPRALLDTIFERRLREAKPPFLSDAGMGFPSFRSLRRATLRNIWAFFTFTFATSALVLAEMAAPFLDLILLLPLLVVPLICLRAFLAA